MEGGLGTLIGGRFQLVEPIGQGGMGRVWRGHDQVLNRDVAVKEVVFPANLSGSQRDNLLARTTREAQSTARLNHPCVVTIHDVVQHDGVPWIVMEYVPGHSLGAAISGGARLPWERVAGIGAKVADALAHAHAAGIVHRDLKPDNVLLSGDRVVVTDFGIARMIDASLQLTSHGTVLGTPHYMAPEQLEGAQAGAAADMWSLGATMYAAVEGTVPFDGPTLAAIITAILIGTPPPPEHAGPLAAVLGKLLVKDPAQRPDATELARELRAAVLQATMAAPAPAPPAPEAAPAPVLQQAAAPAAERPAPAAEPITRPAPVMVASPPSGVPAASYPLTVSTPPPVLPGAPEAAPGQAPPGPGRPRAISPAIAGLMLAIVSAAAAIVAMPLSRYSVPGKSDAFGYAAVIVPLVVAVIALARPGIRRPLLPYVLGAAFVSPAGLLWDVLAVPAYHPFGDNPWMPPRDGAHVKAWFVLTTVGDIAAVAAVAILLIAVRRMSERGRWSPPRVIPALLLAMMPLALAAWAIVKARAIYLHESTFVSDLSAGKFLSIEHPFVVSVIAGLVLAVIAARYALGLQARLLGAMVLLGWTVSRFFSFAQAITLGWPGFPGAVALNWAAALLMLATAALAIVYGTRRAPGTGLRAYRRGGQAAHAGKTAECYEIVPELQLEGL